MLALRKILMYLLYTVRALRSLPQDLSKVELAIEAVPEKEDLKKSTFALLDEVGLLLIFR